MRSDMVPGAAFPDYEGFPTTPWCGTPEAFRTAGTGSNGSSSSAAAAFARRTGARRKGLVELHRELEVGYCRLVTISTDTITETRRISQRGRRPLAFPAPMRGGVIQKDLDIAEYTDPAHNPMIPHVIVLEPGLVIYKIYNGYLVLLAGRPWKSCGRPCAPSPGNAGRTGTSQRRNSGRPGSKAARSCSTRTAGLTSRLSVNRISTESVGCVAGAAARREFPAAIDRLALTPQDAAFAARASEQEIPEGYGTVSFALRIPDPAIADLKTRLGLTRFPDAAPGEPWAYGASVDYMRGLVAWWKGTVSTGGYRKRR